MVNYFSSKAWNAIKLILAIALCIGLVYWSKAGLQEQDEEYDKAVFNAVLIAVKPDKNGTNFKTSSDKMNKYYFRDMFVESKTVPSKTRLSDIAEVGDSIYKETYGDTLFLLKKNGGNHYFVIDRARLYE